MANTDLQQQTLLRTPTGASRVASFAQFDPNLGTLTGISLTLGVDVMAAAAIENYAPVTSRFSLSFSGLVSVQTPNGTIMLEGEARPSTTVTLGAYDGIADFLGQSGTFVGGVSLETLASGNFTPTGADLAAFLGTGTVDLTVLSKGSTVQEGPANFLAAVMTDAGARIGLQYEFIPGPGTSTTGGGVLTNVGNIGGGFPFTFAGAVTSAAQAFTLPMALSGWEQSIDVARFDASLGTLLAVNVGFVVDAASAFSVENLSADAATVTAHDAVNLDVVSQGATVHLFSVQQPTNPAGITLAPNDGVLDFGGASGRQDVPITAIDDFLSVGQVTNADLLSRFIGTGVESLNIGTAGRSEVRGGGNMLTAFRQQVGATVSVSYVYSAAVACFAAGTRIATPEGMVAVEALRVGQAVSLLDGASAPIVWIGHRDVACDHHPRPASVRPIRIAAGAFAPGVPARDLFLSPDHAVFTDEVLIPARYLVNDTSVTQVPVARIRYFHIELPAHAAVLAEGLPTESFLDCCGRSAFANGGAVVQAHPDFAARRWEAEGFAPLVVTGPILAAVRTRLCERARAFGLAA